MDLRFFCGEGNNIPSFPAFSFKLDARESGMRRDLSQPDFVLLHLRLQSLLTRLSMEQHLFSSMLDARTFSRIRLLHRCSARLQLAQKSSSNLIRTVCPSHDFGRGFCCLRSNCCCYSKNLVEGHREKISRIALCLWPLILPRKHHLRRMTYRFVPLSLILNVG